jgi:hypothetical protein
MLAELLLREEEDFDEEQGYILKEIIRYFDSESAGTSCNTTMCDDWPAVVGRIQESSRLKASESQVDPRAGPLQSIGLAVPPFLHAFGGRRRLPLRAHVQQVDEEVVRQCPGPVGEDAVFGPAGVRTEDAQAADGDRHLRSRQRQQLRPVHQRFLRHHDLPLATDVVAEAVGTGFERRKGFDVGLLLRRVCAPGREGNLHVVSGALSGLLDRRGAAENDQVGKRNLLAAGLRCVELLLDRLEFLKDLRQLSRLVDLPILCAAP